MHRLSRRSFFAGCAVILAARRSSAQEQALRIVYPFAAGGAIDAVAPLARRTAASNPFPVRHRGEIHRSGRTDRGQVGHPSRAGRDNSAFRDRAPNFASAAHLSRSRLRPDVGFVSGVARHANRLGACGRARTCPRAVSKSSRVGWDPMPRSRSTARPVPARRPISSELSSPKLSGLELRHVPYRGTGAAMPDLLAGRVPIYIAATPELIEQHKAGRIRIISTTGSRRSVLLPDVPTFTEQGVKIVAPLWAGVYVPAKTPRDVVERLNGAIVCQSGTP